MPEPDQAVDEVLTSAAFAHFNATVVECIEAGIFVGGDPCRSRSTCGRRRTESPSLMIAKPYLPWGDREEVIDRVLCCAALGHAAMGLFDGEITPEVMTAWIGEQRRAQSG